MTEFEAARERMVEEQIIGRGLRDDAVIAAMRAVPREGFLPPDLRWRAYEDGPLPIGEGQTISQPYIVALMIAAAAVRPGQRVLEVGAGCGYAAAVLGRIAGRVVAIERHAALGEAARERLARLGFGNVEIRIGDGTLGCPGLAPFDAILVSAGGPSVPTSLERQLCPGGRLVIPVSGAYGQTLLKLTRIGPDRFDREDLGMVSFVPLIGAAGYACDG